MITIKRILKNAFITWLLFIPFILSAQGQKKFIKYVLLDRHVKIQLPEKWQPLTDEQISLNNKDPKPQKSWIYEKRSASLDMFVFNISLNLSPDKVIKVLWEENFSYADSTLYLDFQTKRIYSNKTSGRVDILIGHSDPKTYGCLFGTYYLEGKFVLFMFTCPHAEMPKLSGIINEMVASLEAW